jgi:tRNA A37 threonylcarbamoyladenosine synthetase subunit TsaC/SUA5/YrdC
VIYGVKQVDKTAPVINLLSRLCKISSVLNRPDAIIVEEESFSNFELIWSGPVALFVLRDPIELSKNERLIDFFEPMFELKNVW